MEGTSNAAAANELSFCRKVIAALIASIAGSAKGNHAGRGRKVKSETLRFWQISPDETSTGTEHVA